MPIYPLPVLSEEEELDAIERLKPPKTVVVRYGYMKQIGEFPYNGDQVIGCGTKLVIKSPRGVELGEMLTTTCTNSGCGSSISRQQMLEYIENSGGKQYPFTTDGKVLRIASAEDLNDQSRVESEKPEYVKLAKSLIREMDLPMKLVDVEPLLSRDRIVFYFTSEQRVDFRQLVGRLASELHVRIEMRQVGARDEARLVADYEKCGQHCCCKQFLKVLKPVSMKSAKLQKATLDPAKISGRCGRLMCCLRYEDQTYDQLRKNLPPRNTRVMTEEGPGTVVNTQILTQLALVELDQTHQRFAFPVENIERLTPEQEAEAKQRREEAAEAEARRESRQRERQQRQRRPKPGQPLRDEEVESREGERADQVTDKAESTQDQPAEASAENGQRKGRKRRRRRRRRRRRGGGGEGGGGDSSGPAPTDN